MMKIALSLASLAIFSQARKLTSAPVECEGYGCDPDTYTPTNIIGGDPAVWGRGQEGSDPSTWTPVTLRINDDTLPWARQGLELYAGQVAILQVPALYHDLAYWYIDNRSDVTNHAYTLLNTIHGSGYNQFFIQADAAVSGKVRLVGEAPMTATGPMHDAQMIEFDIHVMDF